QKARVFNEGWHPIFRRPDKSHETTLHDIEHISYAFRIWYRVYFVCGNNDVDVAFERRIVVIGRYSRLYLYTANAVVPRAPWPGIGPAVGIWWRQGAIALYSLTTPRRYGQASVGWPGFEGYVSIVGAKRWSQAKRIIDAFAEELARRI